MSDIAIPHAARTWAQTDPPRKIIHIVTRLEKLGTPGFDAQATDEMMQAIGRLIGPSADFDAYELHHEKADASRT